MDLADAAGLWDAEPGWLNTASYGLPPRPAWDALQAALADWRLGRTGWAPWNDSVDRSRLAFARMVGAPAGDIAIGATVSGLMSVAAAALPPGARVVVPEIEFTSNLFPWLVQAGRGVTVDCVPLDELAGSIDARTTLVAFSLVQSATGEIAPVDDIVQAARGHDALVCVDASQACGWLPVRAPRFDMLVCAGYKWLMAPRGAVFGYLSPAIRERLLPTQAGWYAGQDVHDSYYGPPLRLADSARRFDTSPAWFSFVGAAPALELLNDIGIEAVQAHNARLGRRFLAGLGLPATGSAIVSVARPGAAERLNAAGLRAAVRAGRARLSFHLYTTDADVDRALSALSGG